MRCISYSAPGKVIISGEHAVVYGKPALVCAINKRLQVDISLAQKQGKHNYGMRIIDKTVRTFLIEKKIPIHEKKYVYAINSDIPIGRGLGSSSALCIAGCAALLELYTNKQWSTEEVNNCAYKAEKIFHTNPSGVDNTASAFGGLIYYRKEFEFLKIINKLSCQIPRQIEHNLCLIDSGEPLETTAEMVEKVGALYNKKQEQVEKSLQTIEKTTKGIVFSLVKEDVQLFEKSVIQNQKELEHLNVVAPHSKKLLKDLYAFGVGKITGAGGVMGGSGYILFYIKEKKGLMTYLKNHHISCIPFHTSDVGLHKHI